MGEEIAVCPGSRPDADLIACGKVLPCARFKEGEAGIDVPHRPDAEDPGEADTRRCRSPDSAFVRFDQSSECALTGVVGVARQVVVLVRGTLDGHDRRVLAPVAEKAAVHHPGVVTAGG